jgi:hypothetical protein
LALTNTTKAALGHLLMPFTGKNTCRVRKHRTATIPKEITVMLVRHDAITLHAEAKEEDFERFMKGEFIPYFSERYKGPTRASIADLKRQSLLKDTKGRRKWLWVTAWDGSLEGVRGTSFEQARMVKFEETDAMLKKLETFGKRAAEKVFDEAVSIEIATNR